VYFELFLTHPRLFIHCVAVNLGKWVLRNLFLGFIREEQRTRRSHDERSSPDGLLTPNLGRINAPVQPDLRIDIPQSPTSPVAARKPKTTAGNSVVFSPKMIPALPPTATPATRSSPLMTPMIPIYAKEANILLPSIPQSPFVESNDATPMPQRVRSSTIDSILSHSNPTPSTATGKDNDYFSIRTRQPSLPEAVPGAVPPTPDDFSAWNGPGKTELPTPSTPGGLMGRFKYFGKISTKKTVSDATSSSVIGTVAPATDSTSASEVCMHF
jgi:WD repeat-containing protein 48